MREAKAHFEHATMAAARAESAPASSSSSSGSSGTASSASQAQTAESGRLHLTSRDGSSRSGSASQRADATADSSGGDEGVLADAQRNPQTALAAAHKATRQPGSSTALVLQFKEGSNTLKASNLVCSADTACYSCTCLHTVP